MTQKYKSNVLVDLDSLLDTRLGTIARIDPDLVFYNIANFKYYNRDEDIFDNIDKDVFRKLYQERDKETLKLSPATQFCRELGKIAVDLSVDSHSQPMRGKAEIFINVYPYHLTDDEMIEIENSILYYTGETLPVHAIRKRPEEITPRFLKNDFSLMIMYDYAPWLELHANDLEKTPLPEVTLLSPRIFYKDKPTQAELDELGVDLEAPFVAMELMLKPMINLELVDVSNWCTIPLDFKELTKED